MGEVNARNSITLPTLPGAAISGTEVVFRPDPTIGDGTYSNNGWLQELPKPQSKMTWDNVIAISPKAATDMHVEKGDVLRVTVDGKSIEGPAWILPGHAEDSVTITFGYGREGSGRVGNKIGYNAYSIQTATAPYVSGGSVVKTGKKYRIANIQETQTMAGREPVRAADLSGVSPASGFPHGRRKTASSRHDSVSS